MESAAQDVSGKFDRQYQLAETDVMRDVERAVCGCDFGGTSWTTEDEARSMADLMGLTTGLSYLEIGAGSGWPSLYLARETGCDAALCDISQEGMRIAAERADQEDMANRCRFDVAGAADLPYEDVEFDAVGHSDVLCCLEDKIEALQECRRVIRDDGIMTFSVIFIAPALSPSDYDRAMASGPAFVDAPMSYPDMLIETGWQVTQQRDLSGEFAGTVERFIRELEVRERAMHELMGEDEFEDLIAHHGDKLDAIGYGLLQRALITVTPV